MARLRQRRRPHGANATTAGGRRCVPFFKDISSYTHTAQLLAYLLLTNSSSCPFLNGIFRSGGVTNSILPGSSSLYHTRNICGVATRTPTRAASWKERKAFDFLNQTCALSGAVIGETATDQGDFFSFLFSLFVMDQ